MSSRRSASPSVPPRRSASSHLVSALVVLSSIGAGWWMVTRDTPAPAPETAAPASVRRAEPETAAPETAATETAATETAATETAATAEVRDTAAPAATSPADTADTPGPGTFTVERLPEPTVDLRQGAPAVEAAAYVVYDAATNRVIAAKQADAPRPVASVIKLLTTLVVLQAGPLDDPVTVPKMTIDAKESQIGLRAGEKLTRAILMRAMLIVSANDAARSLAIDTAGSEQAFVKQMNNMATAIGLRDTVAKSPVGLDTPGAHSTANDVLTLARQVMRNDAVRAAVARRNAKLHGTTFAATNKLLGAVAGVDGVKTGRTTDAGYCVAASATRNGRQVIVVVLGAPTDAARTKAAKALIDWAYAG